MAGSNATFKAVVAWQAEPDHYSALNYCESQSVRVADALATCQGSDVRRAPDVDAATLIRCIGTAASDCTGADILIVFVAGHGATIDGEWRYVVQGTRRNDLAESGVSLDQLVSAARETRALGVLFLIDTCFSGNVTFDSAVWDNLKTRVLGLIAATSPDSESWESSALSGTAFGEAVIECASQGVGASASDKAVTLTQLGEFLGRRVAALSALYSVETEVHLLVVHSPATTVVWATSDAPASATQRRIQFTRRDVSIYVRRSLAVVALIGACVVAIVAGFARMHETASLKGEVIEVRPGMSNFGWFQGAVVRAYATFTGPPESADWLLRDSIGQALSQRFHTTSLMQWEAGRSTNLRLIDLPQLRDLVSRSTEGDPESSLQLAQVNQAALSGLLAGPATPWGPAALEALALNSMSEFESYADFAVSTGTDWMQAMDGLHPPCSEAIDSFLRDRKLASPFARGVADSGALLAGCDRTIADLLTPTGPRIDEVARMAMLFPSVTAPQREELLRVLLDQVRKKEPGDSYLDLLALQYLSTECMPEIIGLARTMLDKPEILVGLVPSLMRCKSMTVRGTNAQFVFHLLEISEDEVSLKIDPSRADLRNVLWIRAAESILAMRERSDAAAVALASTLISNAATRDNTSGGAGVWSALATKLPFNPERTQGSPYQGHERAYWFACAPRIEAASTAQPADFEDWKALAVATVACRSKNIAAEVASINPWTEGFVRAGLGSPSDALAELSAISPAERAGAAQAIAARADAGQLLPMISQLPNDRLPNPEAALVTPLLQWRARFDDALRARSGDSCRELAAMLGGMRGWDARSTIGISQAGIESWLLASTLGDAACGSPAI